MRYNEFRYCAYVRKVLSFMTTLYHLMKELIQVSHQRGPQPSQPLPAFLICTKADTMIRIRRRSYSLEPFSILLLPAHTPFEFEYGTLCEYYLLTVSAAYGVADPMLRPLLEAMASPHFFLFHADNPTERTVLLHLLEQLWQLGHQPTDVDPLHPHRAGAALQYLLLMLCDMQRRTDDRILGKELKRLPARVMQYLEEHYATPITLDQLEQSMLFSKYHICRTFKQEYGVTVFRALERIRLSAAKNAMDHTETPLDQVRSICGFTSYPRFYTAFIRAYGQSPSAYRKGVGKGTNGR